MDVIASLYEALSADDELPELIAAHGSESAIFSGDLAPIDPGSLPYVMLGPRVSDEPDDDFDGPRDRVIDIDVRLYALASQTSLAIDDAAERVRAILHRAQLPAPSGQEGPSCRVSGPVTAPTSSPEIAGRRLTARLYVKG